MAEGNNGSNSPSRFDRIEKIAEVLANRRMNLQQDVKILLRAQAVMGDQLGKLTTRGERGVAKVMAAQKRTGERMDAVILIVDEIGRGRKQQ